MKIRTMSLVLLSTLSLVACSKGDAASLTPTAEPVVVAAVETAVPTEVPTAVPVEPPQEQQQFVISVATSEATEAPVMTMPPAPAPTEAPTPEPTATPLPKLGILDGRFADKFVTGAPVLTNTSYQTDRVAIFLDHVIDDSRTLTNHTYNYFIADVYFQDMEDFRSAPAKSWEKKWDHLWLTDIAKAQNAIFAVSGDFTLTRYKTGGLVTRNGEVLQMDHDPRYDVGVIYRDGHMETYLGQETPVEQLLADPEVWQILGFGPELLEEDGQPKTEFNDPKQVSRGNIRNVVGYYEPGHFCFLYIPPYKVRQDRTCLNMQELSQLMHSLGCVKAFNLDGGATAGMYFNGRLVTDKGMGPQRKNHDIYYIPKA